VAKELTQEDAAAAIRDLLADGMSRKEVVNVLTDDHGVPLSTAYRWFKEQTESQTERGEACNVGHEAITALQDLLRAAQARQDDEAIERLAEKLANTASKLKINFI
jgi:orotate phosphoribosyltransferase